MSGTGQRSPRRKFVWLLWLIPVAALLYILWMNLLPLGGVATYFIDIGASDVMGQARLVGPADRVSAPLVANDTTFRLIEDTPVYVALETRRLGLADDVGVSLRFRDDFAGVGRFMLGVRESAEPSYLWKDIYVPLYEQLAHLTPVAEDAAVRVYAVRGNSTDQFDSVDEFLHDPPLGSVIATNDPGLRVNQALHPSDYLDILADELVAGDDCMQIDAADLAGCLPSGASDGGGNASVRVETALRGGHRLWTYVERGPLELTVTKQDLNWYDGPDDLEVGVYSLEGHLEANITIPDDGDDRGRGELGPLQSESLSIGDVVPGVYRIELAGWHDLFIRGIEVNQEKLVVDKRMFLVGTNSLYFGDAFDPEPVVLYGSNCGESELSFFTAHSGGLQQVTLQGNDSHRELDVHTVLTWLDTTVEPGAYQLTVPEQDLDIRSDGYLSFTPDSFFVPTSSSNRRANGSLKVTTALRGGHRFWTYVGNGLLHLELTKQDLNWYEGPDELEIGVYSLDGDPEARAVIPDDGDEAASGQLGPPQSESVTIWGLEPGAYRLDLKGWHDLLIRAIEVNQSRLVVDGRVFPVGVNIGYFDNCLESDPVTLYGNNLGGERLNVATAHWGGLQCLRIEGNNSCDEVDVNEMVTLCDAALPLGAYRLTLPRQDLDIRTDGYLSFTKDSFCLPKRCEVVDLKYDLSWLEENVDYAIVNFGDYDPPVDDNGWLVAEARWAKGDVFVEDDNLRLCYDMPHLSGTQDQDGVPVDWTEIRLEIPPIWERVGQ